jgi:hypothetical protein
MTPRTEVNSSETIQTENRHVKYWEKIADNLKKAGWSLGWLQPWILTGEQCGVLTRMARALENYQ